MRIQYDQSFKDEAMSLAISSDKPYSEIARDLGVNYQTFTTWIKKAMSEEANKAPKTKADYQRLEKELKATRKELELTKKEVKILKEAAAYFAKHSKWGTLTFIAVITQSNVCFVCLAYQQVAITTFLNEVLVVGRSITNSLIVKSNAYLVPPYHNVSY